MLSPLEATCENCGFTEHPQLFDTWTAEHAVRELPGSDATHVLSQITFAQTLHCPECGDQVSEAEAESEPIRLQLNWQ